MFIILFKNVTFQDSEVLLLLWLYLTFQMVLVLN